jgi:YggT family protein
MIADIVQITIQVLTILIIARIVVSWIVMFVASMRWLLYHPVVEFLNGVTEPILAPIRSVMPNFGGIDFSPMIAIILLQVVGGIIVEGIRGT